jgi:hypothetical protein
VADDPEPGLVRWREASLTCCSRGPNCVPQICRIERRIELGPAVSGQFAAKLHRHLPRWHAVLAHPARPRHGGSNRD